MAAEGYAQMRASTADRDRAIEVLQASFVDGRLTREELDLRVGQVLVSPFFAQLMVLTADLPVGPLGRLPAHRVAPVLSPQGLWLDWLEWSQWARFRRGAWRKAEHGPWRSGRRQGARLHPAVAVR